MKENASDPLIKQFKFRFSSAETTEMSGKCVVALATDPNILSLSGKVLPSCDLARRYGLQDVDEPASLQACDWNCVPKLHHLLRHPV